MHIRRSGHLKSEMSLDEPLGSDWDGNELLLSDVLGTEGDLVQQEIEADAERQMLRRALARLDERERRIMEYRFGMRGEDEMTQKDVAELLGISQSYISRLEKKIIERLKKDIGQI